MKKSSEEASALKCSLDEMKTAHAELDKEVWELREGVVEEHELGFRKALRQAALLFYIPADDDHFDVGKDVYQKALVRIEDIPVISDKAEDTPPTPTAEDTERSRDGNVDGAGDRE